MSLKKYMVIPFAEYTQSLSAEPEKVIPVAQRTVEQKQGPYKFESQRVERHQAEPEVGPEVGPEPEPELKPGPELKPRPEPERGLEVKPEPEPDLEPPLPKEIKPQEEEEAHYLQGGSTRGTKRKRKKTQFFWLKP
jgi:cell division protein FtsN